MPVAVLASDIIEDARVRSDLPTLSSTTFITSTYALNMLIESALRLSGIVRTVYGADYFETQSDITTTANVAYVALPTNCTTLKRAHWVRGTDDFVNIERAHNATDTNAWSGGWEARTPKYRLRSTGINFYPTPTATHTVRLTYDTGIIVASTATSIDCEAGWREWMALDLCRKFAMRQELDDAQYLRAQQLVEETIRALAPRDRAGISQVRDVDELPENIRPWLV